MREEPSGGWPADARQGRNLLSTALILPSLSHCLLVHARRYARAQRRLQRPLSRLMTRGGSPERWYEGGRAMSRKGGTGPGHPGTCSGPGCRRRVNKDFLVSRISPCCGTSQFSRTGIASPLPPTRTRESSARRASRGFPTPGPDRRSRDGTRSQGQNWNGRSRRRRHRF